MRQVKELGGGPPGRPRSRGHGGSVSHGRATGPSSCCPRGEDPDLLLPATRMDFPGHLGRTCRGDVRGVSDTALAEPRPSAARWRRECQPGAGLSSGRAACPRLPARRPDRGLRAPHRHRPTPRSSLPRLSSCAKARPPARPEAAARGHPGPSGSSRGGGRREVPPAPGPCRAGRVLGLVVLRCGSCFRCSPET